MSSKGGNIWELYLNVLFCFISYQAKPQDTFDLAQILNNDLAATVKKYPKRFIGLGTLPLQAPDLAVKEMHRCVNELGFPGVQIGSHVNEWDLNAPELYDIYAVSSCCFPSSGEYCDMEFCLKISWSTFSHHLSLPIRLVIRETQLWL